MSDFPAYSPSPAPGASRKRRSLWRTPLGVVAVLIIAIAVGGLLTFCASHGGGAGGRGGRGGRGGFTGGRPPTTVGVAKATLGPIPIEIQALGTVTPLATVAVNARVSGLLERVDFHEGQTVAKGQLLAEIDPRPFRAVLQQAEGALARDEAALANARLDLSRYARLHAQDSIAGQTYDTQAALVRQDAALVAADRGAAAEAGLNLSFTRIVSPIAGRIGLRQVDPGNEITANQATPFAVVTQTDPITVIFSVPEGAIAEIERQGGKGLKTTAFDRAGGTVLATGTLTTLDNLIDTTTGTVKARAAFPNPGGALFPNQFVNVTLLVDTLQNQVTAPTTAVRHGPQGDFVWVLQPDRTVAQRPVKVGPGTAETVSFVSGLAAGEQVITDGGDRLRDGSSVVLPGQAPRAGGGAGRSGWQGHGGGHRRHGPWGGGGQGGGQGGGGDQGQGGG